MNSYGRKELTEYANGKQFEPRKFKGTGLAVACLFDSPSESKILDLMLKIEEVGNKTGIQFIFSEQKKSEIRPHATIIDGKCNLDLNGRIDVYENIKKDSGIIPALKKLEGLDIKFNRLVMGAKSILLVTTNIPPQTINTRTTLKKVFLDCGVEVKEKDLILYITLARLIAPPSIEKLPTYILELEKIQEQIKSTPLDLKTTIPFIGPSINLIPQQLRPF